MKEVRIGDPDLAPVVSSFLSCLATVLELPGSRIPRPATDDDLAGGWTVSRWLGGLGLGLAPIADPVTFAWAGPWIARVRPPGAGPRYVVMFGVPSGVVWDPAGGALDRRWLEAGWLVAAADIAQALPSSPPLPSSPGTVELIWVCSEAGHPGSSASTIRALPGRGLAGDRHVDGRGTFPSGLPGSALTLIEAEVCESFQPPLQPDQHRRNLVTRGIPLNGLVGRYFTIGTITCRGMRLCEPCTVVQDYSGRPILRALVHRAGLRADLVTGGEIAVGDRIVPLASSSTRRRGRGR